MIGLLLTTVLLHPVHATLAEVEWNRQTKRLEVALRLHALDEQWLQKRHQRKRDHSEWAIDYVRRHLRIAPLPKSDEQDTTAYYWLGRQRDGAHVWWYFEIEPNAGKQPQWIEQTTLLKREDDYNHRILILNSNPKRSLLLTKEMPRGNLLN